MSTIVTGLYESPSQAAIAVKLLESQGVDADNISLLAGESFDKEAFAVDTHSKLSEGVALGMSGGGALGALIGGLTAVGTVATGGAGLLVAGPVVGMLAGAGAGAVTGGVLGGLMGAAVPEHEVKYYEDALDKGSVLIGVKCEESDERALVQRSLKGAGAIKVSHA